MPARPRSGYPGVSYRKDKKLYEAYLIINKRKKKLGYFADPEDAYKALQEAKKKDSVT